MAFPTLNAQQEINSRKILEDLQFKKQLLQKGVSPVISSIPSLPTSTISSSMPQFLQGNLPSVPTDISINLTTRTTWNQASNQSFGFFVTQDSIFGNSVLPVLPRFDNPTK